MPKSRVWTHLLGAALFFAGFTVRTGLADAPQSADFPRAEKLSFRIDWRLVTAGTADLAYTRSGADGWQIQLNLQSAGLVNRLYHVLDTYRVFSDDRFCAASTHLDAQEGKRHNITDTHFNQAGKQVSYDERDLVKNTSKHDQVEIAPCTHDILGALSVLGATDLQPGKSMTLPVSDGKKMARVRVVAQAKEALTIEEKKYDTIRYEAFVFDNILYRRKGTLYIWITDDPARLPVQIRVQLGFPVGSVSLELQKAQNL